MSAEDASNADLNKVSFITLTLGNTIAKTCKIFAAIMLYKLHVEMNKYQSLSFMQEYLPSAKKTLFILIILYVISFLLMMTSNIMSLISANKSNYSYEDSDVPAPIRSIL